jgi:hypothetical protein
MGRVFERDAAHGAGPVKSLYHRSFVGSECEVGCAQSQRKSAIAPCSWTPEESQVENCEHQDNANIHRQPFPESVSEEHEIYTDNDGCHRRHVKHDSYLSAHFSGIAILSSPSRDLPSQPTPPGPILSGTSRTGYR